jgi:hypothetical protein
MKPKSVLYTALAAVAVFGTFAFPRSSNGEANAADDPIAGKLLVEIAAQQTSIAENQTKIDEEVAAIAEEVRIGRIFAGRAGGKTK